LADEATEYQFKLADRGLLVRAVQVVPASAEV
jgi:hypothetical protein